MNTSELYSAALDTVDGAIAVYLNDGLIPNFQTKSLFDLIIDAHCHDHDFSAYDLLDRFVVNK